MNAFYQVLVGEVAILTDDSNQNRDFTQTMLGRPEESRVSVSRVNMDEELADLRKCRWAHEAAAKLVQVADEMLNDILEMR